VENPSQVVGRQVVDVGEAVLFTLPGQPCSDHVYWAGEIGEGMYSADSKIEWTGPLPRGYPREPASGPLDTTRKYIYLGNYPWKTN